MERAGEEPGTSPARGRCAGQRHIGTGRRVGPWEGRQPFPRGLAPAEREPRLAGSNVLPEAVQMWSANPGSSGLHEEGSSCRGAARPHISLCLRAEQKSHQLPEESSLVRVDPWSSLGGFLIKAGISLTSLRKLLVWLKGCSYGTEGFWLTLGDDPSCRRMGLGGRGISTKRERGLGF